MIRSLNLDRGFKPTVYPSIGYNMFQFSGGEWHIKILEDLEIEEVYITIRIKNGDDILKLMVAKNALELLGVKKFTLVMPYIPYARQDRQCFVGESFSLKVFANLLNSLNFDKVITFDSHSDVAPALINNCENRSNKEFVLLVLEDLPETPILISPDAGSNKKANKLALEFGLELIKCDKVRDTKTGALSGFEVFSDDLKGQNCLIVDDICDGGGTFIGLAKELELKNCGDLYLFTTHGIYSKGLEELNNFFDIIYCTNSFSTTVYHNLTQFNIRI